MANLSNINNKFLVTTGGNVGINVTGPTKKIDVYQDAVGLGAADFRHVNGNRILINPSYNYYDAYNHIFRGLNGTDTHMTIDLNGNVGIGNPNPLAKLQITSGDSGSSSPWSNADELVLESSGNAGLAFQTPNTGAATIAFQDPESVQAGFIQYLHADNALRFATNGNNERMRIDSSGNVMMGKNSQSGNAALTVKSMAGGNTGLMLIEGDTTNDGHGLYVTTDNKFVITRFTNGSYSDNFVMDSSGNVGIGTTSVFTSNHILNLSGTGIAIKNDTNGSSNNWSSIKNTSTSSGSNLVFQTATGTNTMNDAGNFGIGGEPSVNFEIAKSGARIKMIDGTNQFNMGLWDSVNYRFEGDANRPMFFTSYQGNIKLGISGGTTMTIQSSNVGIGTTSPGALLHVKAPDNTIGSMILGGGNNPVTAVGQINTELNFGSNDGSAVPFGGSIKTVTEFSNGAYVGMAFYTCKQGRSPTLAEAMRITYAGGISFGTTGAAYGTSGQVLTSNGNAAPSWEDASGGSSPWTTSGNNIYNNNSGSVGINNTNPSAHYSPYNQLVVGNGTDDQGITIFAGSNRDSTINFTDNTSTYNDNFIIKVDHDDPSESNNPSFQINFENNRYVTINKQTTGSTQVPQVRLGMFNSSSLPANLDHSMLEIGINNGMNNPGMVMYGDSQGNSNPFIGMVSTSSGSTITTKYLRFYHNTTLCGTIQKRYNANEVQYLTTSDYRLKEDLKPFKALDTICKINVYNYKWKDIEGYNVNYGVLAHELQELIPEVVAGEKDEVNKKGEEEYQSVDYSKLVPHLIQSIQELKAEIELLKSK